MKGTIEQRTFLGLPERKTRKETFDASKVRVMIVGMQGEGGFSGHDPIGIGVNARRIDTDHPGVEVRQYDTQPELAQTGKIDTDKLARELHTFATAPGDATNIIGVGVPIFSVNYLQSTLIKYQQLCEKEPPTNRVEFVLGGAIPTYTDSDLLRAKFPNINIKLVKGEGEERLSEMVRQAARGEELTESPKQEYADLQNYAGADRTLTYGILHMGGMPKTESSRGCGFGNCSFCSREAIFGRGGRDFRSIPAEKVVEEIKVINDLLTEFSGNRFEFADEDAFSNIENTRELVSALKIAQMEEDLPRIPFGASLRVDTLLALAADKDETDKVSLLDQLRDVGLDKVFLGVEGGSNEFLNKVAKGQSIEKIVTAVATVNKSRYKDPETQKDQPLEFEMGYITFAYNMNIDMLRENIRFLSLIEGDPEQRESSDVNITHARHVSSLFNILEVRAGTNDALNIKRNIKKANDPNNRDYEKYQALKNYDPDAHFNINTSCYDNVPFFDSEVKRIYEDVEKFGREDESLFYAIKSITRAKSLPAEMQEKAQEFFLGMKGLHLQFLRNAVGLEKISDIPEQRRELVKEMKTVFENIAEGELSNAVRREINVFFNEDRERREAIGNQRGAMIVVRDDEGKILLARPRGQEKWGFPGGNIKPGESKRAAVKREGREELGVSDIEIGKELTSFSKINHMDATTGHRPRLTLSHFEGKLVGEININNADTEIVDTLWLPPTEIINQRVETQDNVVSIAEHLNSSPATRPTRTPGGVIMFMQQ